MLEAELIDALAPQFRDFLNNVGGTLDPGSTVLSRQMCVDAS